MNRYPAADRAMGGADRHGKDHTTASSEKTRAAICDDHEQFRRGIVEMLSFAHDVEVVGEAATHEEAVDVVGAVAPDVVLLDLEMPGAFGADESMGRMLSLPSPPKIVVFTMHDEPGMVRRFLSRGATTYVAKSAEMDELVDAVRNAARAGASSKEMT